MSEVAAVTVTKDTNFVTDTPSSDAIRARQLVLAEEFIQLCKTKGRDLEAEENVFTPKGKVEKIQKLWHEPVPALYQDPDNVALLNSDTAPQMKQELVSLRDQTQRSIYWATRKTTGALNEFYVKRHDPAVMRMVEGIIREYVLCHHWDTLVKAISPDEYAVTGNKKKGGPLTQSVEKVRAKIASHYVQSLQEQGYSAEDSIQIVGHAILAYMRLTDFAKWQDVSSVKPLKVSSIPSEMVLKIHEHDRLVDPGFRSK